MGREVKFPPTDEMYQNALTTICRANAALAIAQMNRRVVSGYRPVEINKLTPGAAKNSKHLTCQAVDLEDKDRSLANWCNSNLQVLADVGLWMESTQYTPTWVHWQIVPPK